MSYSNQSLDAVTLRGIFLQAARDLFSDPESYGDLREKLDRFVWRPDGDKDGTLLVDLDWEFNPITAQPRQAVYVGLDDIVFTQAVLDNKAEVSEDRARVTYIQPAATTLRIRAVSPNSDEPLYLATVASAYFCALRPLFMQQLNLTQMNVVKLSAPALVKGTPDSVRLFESALVVSLAYHHEIVVSVEGHRMKTWRLNTLPLTG